MKFNIEGFKSIGFDYELVMVRECDLNSSCLIARMGSAFQYGFVINPSLHILYKLDIF